MLRVHIPDGIRMQAQSANSLHLAKWLESHPAVSRVYYPGLESHDQHELAMKQQSGSGAAVVSFDVAGKTPQERRKNAFHVIDSTQVVSIAAVFCASFRRFAIV